MASTYKLRCNIVGHQKDVRAVASTIFPEGGIVSGSRDVTSRIWVPNEHNPSFTEGHVMSGHSNFVASVCVVPPDDTYPNGLIITGSNDNTILAFTLESPQPVFKLTGHTGTVCAVASGKFGFLLSGSWDKTAKVWLKQKCVMTLEGHEAAVWAVAVISEHGMMLTGSADKSIKLWKAGKCEKTFHGHEDCVRGLAVMTGGEFLSCSNDATVKRWLLTGDCVATYYGHANYVYSVALLPNGQDFVTSSEDRTVKVWRGPESAQTIPHPTQSVWSVCTLPNGDIVTGASDGIIRVFTSAPERMASAEELQAYEEQVSASTVPAQVGDIKTEDIPGPEVLINPGRKDGQQKMVRQGDKIELYQWDAAKASWTKIGDVVGSSGGSQQTSGKTLYEGKEYDYVFSVDIQEGMPPLKLPYNVSEDPWFAAQRFLDKHDLSQMFLDQVAKFITDNTKGVTLGTEQPAYSDPFTGEGRYVPGSTAAPGAGAGAGATHGADPFTGSGSYKPAGSSSSSSSSTSTSSNSFFPLTSFLTFDQANPTQIIGKIKELNVTVSDSLKVPDSRIDDLSSLISGQSASQQQLQTVQSLLAWPSNVVFPALDVVRICVKHPLVNQAFSNQATIQQLISFITPDNPPACQMLALRSLTNLFSQSQGRKAVCENRDTVLGSALSCRKTNKNVQIAIGTVILNYAIALRGTEDIEGKSQCLSAARNVLEASPDHEASFRVLVSIGTILSGDEEAFALAQSLGLQDPIVKLGRVTEPKKVPECAQLVLNILRV
ncbi:phospholipase A-2-activating protein-like [Haliotis cracherodii]|uniref:phospholipase A-2-activating protein-like n=1 Tax=Haliotis cracherodii TaxID=6455 RepID=UPI0039E99DA4